MANIGLRGIRNGEDASIIGIGLGSLLSEAGSLGNRRTGLDNRSSGQYKTDITLPGNYIGSDVNSPLQTSEKPSYGGERTGQAISIGYGRVAKLMNDQAGSNSYLNPGIRDHLAKASGRVYAGSIASTMANSGALPGYGARISPGSCGTKCASSSK